jgi:hypothetical protein
VSFENPNDITLKCDNRWGNHSGQARQPPSRLSHSPELTIKNHPQSGWFCFHYHQPNPSSLTPNGNQPNGGVRGGTLRLLPVDLKAEATQQAVALSHTPAQTSSKLK